MTSIGTRTVWARDTIDQALREDVEAGAISYNDFERTKKFASDMVQYQYYTTFAGIGAVVGTVLYRHWYRRQPFNLRSVIFLPLVYTMGSAPCWFAQASAFRQYQRSLENPGTTIRALLKSRGMVLTAGENPKHRPGQHQQMDNGDKDNSDSPGQAGWELVRATDATKSSSSWDRIRQRHEIEPERMKGLSQSPDPPAHSSSEREIEQAKFDMLLEAERKMSG